MVKFRILDIELMKFLKKIERSEGRGVIQLTSNDKSVFYIDRKYIENILFFNQEDEDDPNDLPSDDITLIKLKLNNECISKIIGYLESGRLTIKDSELELCDELLKGGDFLELEYLTEEIAYIKWNNGIPFAPGGNVYITAKNYAIQNKLDFLLKVLKDKCEEEEEEISSPIPPPSPAISSSSSSSSAQSLSSPLRPVPSSSGAQLHQPQNQLSSTNNGINISNIKMERPEDFCLVDDDISVKRPRLDNHHNEIFTENSNLLFIKENSLFAYNLKSKKSKILFENLPYQTQSTRNSPKSKCSNNESIVYNSNLIFDPTDKYLWILGGDFIKTGLPGICPKNDITTKRILILKLEEGGLVSKIVPVGKTLKNPIHYFQTALFKNRIYIIGGCNRTKVNNILEHFSTVDLSEQSKISYMSISRAMFGVATLNDKIYLMGGVGSCFSDPNAVAISEALNSVQVLQPELDNVDNTTSLLGKRIGVRAVSLNNQIFAMGGAEEEECMTEHMKGSVEIYNPLSKTWEFGPEMCKPRTLGSAFEINGHIIYVGGNWKDNKPDIEYYSPEKKEWSLIDSDLPLNADFTNAILIDFYVNYD